MSDKSADTTIAHQVELTISQLDSLAILPYTAVQFLSSLNQFQLTPSALAELIESSPALTARIFSLAYQADPILANQNPSIHTALEKLSIRTIRDTLLATKVCETSTDDEQKTVNAKKLVLHSLAVACCAESIAEFASDRIDSNLAYLAGLLHDIGKLALDQTMPKSFNQITEQAKSLKSSSSTIEQNQLGIDHTILGKRLAQKWHLPEQITTAIWLHHSNTDIISTDMPETLIAQIVQLADGIARQCGIGCSGSFDSTAWTSETALSLGINAEQLQQIEKDVILKVSQKAKVLGMDSTQVQNNYCQLLATTTAQLAKDNTKLSEQVNQLQTTAGHLDFTTGFLADIAAGADILDIAENFATRWQKFYQTGPVCLYLTSNENSKAVNAVIVKKPGESKKLYFNSPAETSLIPEAIENKFTILDAQNHLDDQLTEQIGTELDLSRTKLIPLLCGSKAIGVIVFELRYPVEAAQMEENFKAAASIAGVVLQMASAWQKQQCFAERFANLIVRPKDIPSQPAQPQPSKTDDLSAMIEMAAGAAHELNNPLSVISGRVQLLAETETDSEKKQVLQQIDKNAGEISLIIDELMSFARPQPPRPSQTNIKQILDEATELAAQKTNSKQLNVNIDIQDTCQDVFVDSAQIASAIANIFSNSIESYSENHGQIDVVAVEDESTNCLKLSISDTGCGMDPQTLQKAIQPFFSAKPAGRKRGMGLAYAIRLIQLNNSSAKITSELDHGTKVTILLPCSQP